MRERGLPLGALGDRAAAARASSPPAPAADEIAIAVVGAHLSGMPLNANCARSARASCEATRDRAGLRLFALDGTRPPKPGLLRVGNGEGAAIEVEIWALSADALRPLRRRRPGAARRSAR